MCTQTYKYKHLNMFLKENKINISKCMFLYIVNIEQRLEFKYNEDHNKENYFYTCKIKLIEDDNSLWYAYENS
jgi:hypothetical protein